MLRKINCDRFIGMYYLLFPTQYIHLRGSLFNHNLIFIIIIVISSLMLSSANYLLNRRTKKLSPSFLKHVYLSTL
jgi:hypothetical protein